MDRKYIRKGKDYHTYFDSDWFFQNSFLNLDDNGFRPGGKFMFDSVCEVFRSGAINGKRMVDIGSGPSIQMAIPAARWFEDIILTDFTERDRKCLRQWIENRPEAHNWENHFRYYAKMENNESQWQTCEREVRAKVKEVLPCDVNVSAVLSKDMVGTFDCVSSCLVLDIVAENIEHYRKCFANLVRILKPGGYLVLCGLLKSPGYYTVGKETFWGFRYEQEDVFTAAKMAEVETLHFLEQKVHRDERFGHVDSAYVLVARKRVSNNV